MIRSVRRPRAPGRFAGAETTRLLEDLTASGPKAVLYDRAVPCGAAARAAPEAGDKVEGVEFPEAVESAEAVDDCPITLPENAPNPAAAEASVELVKSPESQRVLGAAGFPQP